MQRRVAAKIKVVVILDRRRKMLPPMGENISRVITSPIRICTWIQWGNSCRKCTQTQTLNLRCLICILLSFLCQPRYPIWRWGIYRTPWCRSRCILWLCPWSNTHQSRCRDQINTSMTVWRWAICRNTLLRWFTIIKTIPILPAIPTWIAFEDKRSSSLRLFLISLLTTRTPLILPISLHPSPRGTLRGKKGLRSNRGQKINRRLLNNTSLTKLLKISESSLLRAWRGRLKSQWKSYR